MTAKDEVYYVDSSNAKQNLVEVDALQLLQFAHVKSEFQLRDKKF